LTRLANLEETLCTFSMQIQDLAWTIRELRKRAQKEVEDDARKD
jgi:hypothetical protein